MQVVNGSSTSTAADASPQKKRRTRRETQIKKVDSEGDEFFKKRFTDAESENFLRNGDGTTTMPDGFMDDDDDGDVFTRQDPGQFDDSDSDEMYRPDNVDNNIFDQAPGGDPSKKQTLHFNFIKQEAETKPVEVRKEPPKTNQLAQAYVPKPSIKRVTEAAEKVEVKNTEVKEPAKD